MAERTRRSARPAVRHTWNLLGSKYSLSAWVGLIFAFPSLLSALLLIDREGHGQWWTDVLFCIIAWAVPVAVLGLVRLAWFPRKSSASRPLLMMAAFLLAGAARGLAIAWLEPVFGLVPASNPVVRSISEILTIAASLAIIAVAVSARLTYRDALTALASDREELLQMQMGAAEEFHSQRDSLVTEAQDILSPILRSLKESLSSAKDSAALASVSETMRSVVDDVVRPLSAALAQRSPDIERRGRLVPHSNARVVRTDTRVNLGLFILPFTVNAFVLVMTTGALVVLLGLAVGVQAVELMVLSLFLTLWLARLATWRLRLSAAMATLAYCLIHAIAAAVFIAVSSLARIYIAPTLLAGWVLVLVGIAFLLMRYQLVEWVRADVIESQAAVNEELEIALSSLRQQVRVESKRVATILHGPVQTALYAAAIRLTSNEVLDTRVADEVIRDLEAAMQRLESEVVAPLPLEDFVAEVSRVWGDSITLTFDQAESAIQALANNPTALACVTEVIREGVNNAIKHARATRVSIDVFMREPLLVEVTVKNATTDVAVPANPGLGTDVLVNVTHEWSLKNDGETTTLWASVALDQIQ